MNSTKYLVLEGDICILGKDSQGKDVKVTAEIADLEITVDQDLEFGRHWAAAAKETHFKMRVNHYTVALPPSRGVERTARVLMKTTPESEIVTEPTLAEVRAAAEKAGVVDDTEFYVTMENDVCGGATKTYVNFKWED